MWKKKKKHAKGNDIDKYYLQTEDKILDKVLQKESKNIS